MEALISQPTEMPMKKHITTPVEMLGRWVETQGDDTYLRQPIDGQYKEYTWREVQTIMHQLAGALKHLGFKPWRQDWLAL